MTASLHMLGSQLKLSYNTGTYGTPVWNPLDIIMDNDHDESTDAVEATTRGSYPYREYIPGLVDISEEFKVAYKSGDTDTDFVAIEAHKRNRTIVEVAVSDGLMATAGVKYMRFQAIVTDCKRGEALGDLATMTIKLQPAAENGGHHPEFGTVA